MARIRTIKPEFWTSQQVVECSMNARLLFVGLWNFCDDNGVHPAEPKRLKMEVFPGDLFTVDEVCSWISELLKVGLLREYDADGQHYWFVTGWKKHQRIDRPNNKYPLPDDSNSPKDRRTLDESSPDDRLGIDGRHPPEGKGVEGKGKESISSPYGEDVGGKTADLLAVGRNKSTTLPCPQQEIITLYHELLPMCPRVREWTKNREGLLRARWGANSDRQTLDWWRRFFAYVSSSTFLTGQSEPSQGRPPFVADLEWLISPKNFAKVIEGRYENKKRGAA